VELNDLKNAAHFVMDMVEMQVAREEPKPTIVRLLAAPQKLIDHLKATSLTATTTSLVRVKSHHPEVDIVKVEEGPDTTKDLKAVVDEIREAAEAIMEPSITRETMVKSSRSLRVVPPPSSSHVDNNGNLLLSCVTYLAYVCLNLVAPKQYAFFIPH
jgi:hypothetical protein